MLKMNVVKKIPEFVRDVLKRAERSDTLEQCEAFLIDRLKPAGYTIYKGRAHLEVNRVAHRTYAVLDLVEEPAKVE